MGFSMANASMQNTSVTFDGTPAPLLTVSSTQLMAIVPFEVSSKSSTQLQVTVNGQKSAAVTMTVTAAAPGLFTLAGTGSGLAAALNQDGSVNGPSNPAAKGSVISLYATGTGQTNPGGVTGQAVTSALPRVVAPVLASIDGQSAQVNYAGGASGLLSSVSQVNVTVPAGAGTGNVSLTISVGGTVSQTGVTVWVK